MKMTALQSLPNRMEMLILEDRNALLEHKDLIPDPRYPLFTKTLLFLMKMCYNYKPKRILDTGSGMTSILLRKYNPDAMVVTVDNNDYWKKKTDELFKRFDVELYNKHVHSLMSDRVFKQYPWDEKFDMLIHDIGNMDFRLHTLPTFIAYAAESCVALFDNFGVPPYKELAHPFLLSKGFIPLYPADPMSLSMKDAGEFATYHRGYPSSKPLYNILL